MLFADITWIIAKSAEQERCKMAKSYKQGSVYGFLVVIGKNKENDDKYPAD